jgi:general secretion pathway protein C
MRLKRFTGTSGQSFRPTLILVNLGMIALLGATTGYWGLTLTAPPIALPPATAALADTNDISVARNLFGAEPVARAPAAQASRLSGMKVLGIVTDRGNPAAILSLDGKPARAYGVGDEVAPGLRIGSIDARRVRFMPDGAGLELPAPERPAAASGSVSPRPPIQGISNGR